MSVLPALERCREWVSALCLVVVPCCKCFECSGRKIEPLNSGCFLSDLLQLFDEPTCVFVLCRRPSNALLTLLRYDEHTARSEPSFNNIRVNCASEPCRCGSSKKGQKHVSDFGFSATNSTSSHP